VNKKTSASARMIALRKHPALSILPHISNVWQKILNDNPN
jgi:hypothetical protein